MPLADIDRLYKVNYLEDPIFDDTFDVCELSSGTIVSKNSFVPPVYNILELTLPSTEKGL